MAKESFFSTWEKIIKAQTTKTHDEKVQNMRNGERGMGDEKEDILQMLSDLHDIVVAVLGHENQADQLFAKIEDAISNL